MRLPSCIPARWKLVDTYLVETPNGIYEIDGNAIAKIQQRGHATLLKEYLPIVPAHRENTWSA